ncbi:MAG: nodulation protein NfeD [Thermococci archaeon]|nr:nodulation protein NfeD [Thermococci archaeon]
MKRLVAVIVLAVFLLQFILAAPASASPQRTVYVVKITGVITGYTADQFSRYIHEAEAANAEALVVEFDTPGGRGDAMMKIVQSIERSTVPVIIYVYPEGAIAASAGTYIALGSHLIAMAPGTAIGACEPILGYAKNGSIIKAPEKIRNFYTAYIMSLANTSNRNVTAAREFISVDLSLTPQEALKDHVIEVIAQNVTDLLHKANGMTTKIPVAGKGYVKLNFTNVHVVYVSPSLKDRIVSYITDPTVAYLLMELGIIALVLGFLTPTWHVPETIGAIMLVLGLIGIGYFGYNSAGIVLMVLGVVFFIAEALTSTFGLFTVAGVVSTILGGILLFGGGNTYFIKTSVFTDLRYVIIAVAAVIGAFFAFGVAAVVRAQRRKAKTGREEMVGLRGEVVKELNPEGMVRVRGELWKAVSVDGSRIPRGSKVEVVELDGLTLRVKKVESASEISR